MSEKKITTIAVYPKDADRLWDMRGDRKKIPDKTIGRGRRPAEKETFADVFKWAVDALEKEESK